MQIATSDTNTNQAPTLGWDSIFVVSIDEINHEIKKQDKYPHSITVPHSKKGKKFGFKVDCECWQVTTGGGGVYVNVLIPLRNLKATYTNADGSKGTVTCDALDYTVAIRLDVVTHDGPAVLPDGTVLEEPKKGTTRHKMTAATTSSDPENPVASLVRIDYLKPLSNAHAKGIIERNLLQWVNDNLDQFEHVFAFLDLEDEIATGPWAMFKPHTSAYAYTDITDTVTGKTSGSLAVLSMTSGDPIPKQQEVNGFALPQGCGVAFLVSPKRFLLDLVVPALQHKWPQLRRGQLVLSPDETKLSFRDGYKIHLPAQEMENGKKISPVLSKFSVEILGSELIISAFTDVEFNSVLGYHATCSSKEFFKLNIGKNAKGEQTLVFETSRTQEPERGSYSSLTGEIVEIGLEALAAFAVIIGLAVPMILDIMSLLAAALLFCKFMLDESKRAHADDAPSLEDLMSDFTGPIRWTDKSMQITQTGLPSSLRLAGHLV